MPIFAEGQEQTPTVIAIEIVNREWKKIDDNEANEKRTERATAMDPANLLPFVCVIEPDDPNVTKLPSAFKGSMGYREDPLV